MTEKTRPNKIWIYHCERRRNYAIKDLKRPLKGHANSNDATHSHGREKQHQDHKRPHKTMHGQIRPYKAITAIQYHNVPQKHIFCSLAQFLFDLEHFSLMFPRQEQQSFF